MYILLIGAATIGLCFLFDKGFTAIFRGKTQHKTGLSVRLSQHYGGAGIILFILGLAALIYGWNRSFIYGIGGILMVLLGAGLVTLYDALAAQPPSPR